MIKEQIGFLVKLQTIETETLNIKSLISDACKKLDKVDADLKEFEKTIAQEESLMDEQKKKCRSYESDLESNLSQIKKSQEKLSSIKTNREYKSLLKETEELKTKSSQIENEIIACLDLIEKTEKSILFCGSLKLVTILSASVELGILIRLLSHLLITVFLHPM